MLLDEYGIRPQEIRWRRGGLEQPGRRDTGIFPTMHVVGIRKSLVERLPWLPVSVYKAFLDAKRHATEDLKQVGHLAVTLPWSVAELEATKKLMVRTTGVTGSTPIGMCLIPSRAITTSRVFHRGG
jgi:hypothetical protein